MATHDSAEVEHPSNSIEWTMGSKLRDGRYGPVFLGLRTDTGDLISTEELTPGEHGTASSLENIVTTLESRLAASRQPNVVSLLGYELKGGKVVVLTEYVPGGTLRHLIQSYGAVPQPLARSILRQVVLGLEQLREREIAPVFLDLDMVMLDNRCVAKIEAPLRDGTIPTTAGEAPAAALLAPPPELLLGQEDLVKADVWLLGVIAAQILIGKSNPDRGTPVATRIGEFPGSSAVELLVSGDAGGKLDRDALDLIGQCLSMDVNRRPGISDLLEHPFFKGAD